MNYPQQVAGIKKLNLFKRVTPERFYCGSTLLTTT
jgi:hypothetical protein